MPTADRRPSGQPRQGPLLRPYALTRGRVHDHDELELEALVATTSLALTATHLYLEQRTITQLCRDLLSVAEISAKMRLPLQVARVLVGDLADQGLLQIYRPGHPDQRPDLALLERVLDGLRRI